MAAMKPRTGDGPLEVTKEAAALSCASRSKAVPARGGAELPTRRAPRRSAQVCRRLILPITADVAALPGAGQRPLRPTCLSGSGAADAPTSGRTGRAAGGRAWSFGSSAGPARGSSGGPVGRVVGSAGSVGSSGAPGRPVVGGSGRPGRRAPLARPVTRPADEPPAVPMRMTRRPYRSGPGYVCPPARRRPWRAYQLTARAARPRSCWPRSAVVRPGAAARRGRPVAERAAPGGASWAGGRSPRRCRRHQCRAAEPAAGLRGSPRASSRRLPLRPKSEAAGRTPSPARSGCSPPWTPRPQSRRCATRS